MTYYRHVLLALPVLLSACGETGSTGNSTAASTTAASASAVNLGGVGKATGIEMTIIKVDQRNQLGSGPAALKATAGETYVVVHYAIKNIGVAPITFTERPSYSLVDAKGQTYSDDVTAATLASDGLDELSGMANDINPNTSAKSVAVWKVEKAAFDKGTWKLVVASGPQLTFSLK